MWKIPAEDGESIQITNNGGVQALESPDGRFLYFGKRGPAGGPRGIWRIPVDGGEEVQVLEHGGFHDWTLVEQGIFYLKRQPGPGAVIEFFEFSTGRVSQVTSLEEGAGPMGFSVSPDQRRILYIRSKSADDIMLVENFR